MKIGIQTWGSYGDIRPFIALAEGLQSAGHEVTLVVTCVDRSLDDLAASLVGIKTKLVASPVIGDIKKLLKIEETVFAYDGASGHQTRKHSDTRRGGYFL